MTQQEPRVSAGDYKTVLFEIEGNVATVTLNRPEVMNAFNQTMVDEFRQIWGRVRADDHIHAVVLRAAGERAFSTGMDVKERIDGIDVSDNPWSAQDPGEGLSPKQNKVWKPVIAAVHGMVAGGAFYWLNDCDIIISADDATFFDPHVSYGLTAALEPIGLARRIPLGEALRWALVGLDERMSARRAREIGLVSELHPGVIGRLLGREFLQGGTCMIVAGLVGPPCLNCFQLRRRVKSPGANGDPVSGQPRPPEKRGAAFLAEGVSRLGHWVEPPQVAFIIFDLQVSGFGRGGGHVMTGEAPAPVAMAVDDVPQVSEDLEGDPTAKAPPRGPGCRAHVRAPPYGRLSISARPRM